MNTNFTKNPIVGTPLTPSVIKQIHTAVRRFMPIAGNGIRTTVTAGGTIISAIPAPASKKQKDKPLPFEVRFDGTLDSGSGGWKIYLPTEHLVFYATAYLDPIGGVTAILDGNGDETGWYTFDDITLQATHIWLVISESSGSYSANLSATQGSGAVANICIAEVSYTAATQSEPASVETKQSAVGAITLGGGGMSGTVEFVSDVDWYYDSSYHVIRKRIKELNLATGVVTDKDNTTFANGWEIACPSTPISSIIN